MTQIQNYLLFITLIVVACFPTPFFSPSGGSIVKFEDILIMLLVFTEVYHFIIRRKSSIKVNKQIFCFFVFWVGYSLIHLYLVRSEFSFQLRGTFHTIKKIEHLLLFLVVLNILTRCPSVKKTAFYGLMIGFIANLGSCLYEIYYLKNNMTSGMLTNISYIKWERTRHGQDIPSYWELLISGFAGGHERLGVYSQLFLFFFLGLFFHYKRYSWQRLLTFLMVVACLWMVVVSQARAQLLGLIPAFFLYCFFARPKLILLIGLPGFIIAPFALNKLSIRLLSTDLTKDRSVQERIQAYFSQWHSFVDSPILSGQGVGYFGMATENQWLRELAETGFVGLTCFSIFIYIIYRHLKKHVIYPELRPFAQAGIYMLISMMFQGCFTAVFLLQKPIIIFYTFLALLTACGREIHFKICCQNQAFNPARASPK